MSLFWTMNLEAAPDIVTCVVDWTDNCRDILNFLIYFLPPAGSSKPVPTHLEKLPLKESEHRRKHGFHDRILIAVGHSYGGCTSLVPLYVYLKKMILIFNIQRTCCINISKALFQLSLSRPGHCYAKGGY